jgi:hypothetical protein
MAAGVQGRAQGPRIAGPRPALPAEIRHRPGSCGAGDRHRAPAHDHHAARLASLRGRLCGTPAEALDGCPGFPLPYGAPAFASWASCSHQGPGPLLPPAYRQRLTAPRTLTGLPRSACTSSDRGGRPLDPEASGVHTASETCLAAACRSSTARPCTLVFIPSPRALGNEASAGVHSRSPVRSSPRLRPRMERARSGFFPELRTPQLPATHVKAGTGLEHWPGATTPASPALHPQAHSQHATSCRTISAQSSTDSTLPPWLGSSQSDRARGQLGCRSGVIFSCRRHACSEVPGTGRAVLHLMSTSSPCHLSFG